MEVAEISRIRNAYLNSSRRLMFLDYEGTLVPESAGSDDPSTVSGLSELLFQLSSDSLNQVIVVSDQTRDVLGERFNYLPIILAAERGGFFRSAKSEWESIHEGSLNWKDQVARALNMLTQYYKGSFIDVRHFSLAWNHSAIDRIPREELRQFQVALRSLAKTHALDVSENDRAIEFITPGVNKAKFASIWVSRHGDFDFILAIGNDDQDERLFETLGKDYFTIRVAPVSLATSAKYSLAGHEDVIPFLRTISAENLKANTHIL